MPTFSAPSATDGMLPDEIAAMRGEAAQDDAPRADAPADDEQAAAPADDESTKAAPGAAFTADADDAASQPPQAGPAEFAVEAKDYATERKTLRDAKKEMLTKWSDGDMSDAAYAEAVDVADEQLATLVAEQTRADTLRDIN